MNSSLKKVVHVINIFPKKSQKQNIVELHFISYYFFLLSHAKTLMLLYISFLLLGSFKYVLVDGVVVISLVVYPFGFLFILSSNCFCDRGRDTHALNVFV